MKQMHIVIASVLSLFLGSAAFAADSANTSGSQSSNQAPSANQSGTQASPSAGNANGANANEAPNTNAGTPNANATSTSPNVNKSGQMDEGEHMASNDPALVKQVQQKLSSMGYNPGPVDGALGPKTQAALKKFQHSQGISANGELDQQTLAALGVEGSVTGAADEGSNGQADTDAGAADQEPADASSDTQATEPADEDAVGSGTMDGGAEAGASDDQPKEPAK